MIKLFLLALALILFLPTPVQAWGPRTHIATAELVKASDAFIAGSVLPDVALAVNVSTYRQGYLHKPEYFTALERLADTDELRDFVEGYRLHLVGDGIESIYSANRMREGAPYSADFAVDRQVTIDRQIVVSPAMADLMQRAWDGTYPNRPEPMLGWDVMKSQDRYNAYIAWAYQVVSPQGSWYEDYADYVSGTVDTYLANRRGGK